MRLFRRRRVYADREVLELFADEPELVAIVDAIAATQRRHLRRRGPLVAAAATAAVGVAVVSGVLLPWRGGDVGFGEAALAAVGDGRVVHVVSRRVDSGEQLVDLRTGAARPTGVEVETWYDERSGRLRAVTRREGVVVADALGVATADAAELTALDFGRGYRAALDRADDDDDDEVGEAALVRLRVRGVDYDVVIDRETHLPRRYRRAEDGATWSVSGVDSRPLRPPDFRTRLEPPRYTSGAVASSTGRRSPPRPRGFAVSSGPAPASAPVGSQTYVWSASSAADAPASRPPPASASATAAASVPAASKSGKLPPPSPPTASRRRSARLGSILFRHPALLIWSRRAAPASGRGSSASALST